MIFSIPPKVFMGTTSRDSTERGILWEILSGFHSKDPFKISPEVTSEIQLDAPSELPLRVRLEFSLVVPTEINLIATKNRYLGSFRIVFFLIIQYFFLFQFSSRFF